MTIAFYYSPYSSAVRTHWVLEELGVTYEGKKIDLKSGDQKKPEFLAINPNGKVPTLVDDGIPFFESVAINIHLGQKYGTSKGIWPTTGTKEYGQALSWIVWSSSSLLMQAYRIMQNTAPQIPEEEKNAKAAESARKDFEAHLNILETHLTANTYLAGNTFTVADAHLAADIWWYQMGVIPDLSRWPHIKAWFNNCAERPAFKRISAG